MKKENGITLVSVIVYVIGLVVIVALVSSLLAFYNKNMITINNSSDISIEFSKLNAKLIEETSSTDNPITEITNTKITFNSGNIYEFKDGKLYCNTIVISNYISEFQAGLDEQGDKQILNIYVLHEKGSASLVHNLNYAVILNPNVLNSTTSKILTAAPNVDANGLAVNNTLIKPYKNSNVQIVIPEGFAPAILNGSNWTTSTPGQDGSVKEIMKPEDWNKITIDDINKGIVIVDHAITYDDGNETGTTPDFNEYVWVPIPNPSDFERTSWTIDGFQQTLAESSGESGFWEDTTASEYINMANSVNTNKGFYISRYEASNNGNSVAQSKRQKASWVNISQPNAVTASRASQITNAHLIYGIEWDSALNWIEHTTNLSATDSKNWGNHLEAISPANVSGYGEKQNTGTSEYWKANNIYDLAGNIWEWSQENFTVENYILGTYRGGTFDGADTWSPAAFRETWDKESQSADRRI